MRTLVIRFGDGEAMVELPDDAPQRLATRPNSSSSWGPKVEPIMDDDGDHLRAPELRLVGDTEFAAYLNGLRIEKKGDA